DQVHRDVADRDTRRVPHQYRQDIPLLVRESRSGIFGTQPGSWPRGPLLHGTRGLDGQRLPPASLTNRLVVAVPIGEVRAGQDELPRSGGRHGQPLDMTSTWPEPFDLDPFLAARQGNSWRQPELEDDV